MDRYYRGEDGGRGDALRMGRRVMPNPLAATIKPFLNRYSRRSARLRL
jgi:hypothetical protein